MSAGNILSVDVSFLDELFPLVVVCTHANASNSNSTSTFAEKIGEIKRIVGGLCSSRKIVDGAPGSDTAPRRIGALG